MHEVTMPKLSDSMEEGKIIAWKVKPGDAVRSGDILAEIESDKAVMELESFHDGTVAEIRHGDGAEVRVGEVIALLCSADEEEAPKPRAAPKPPSAKTAKTVRREKHKEETTPPTPPPPKTEPPPPTESTPRTPPSAFKTISPYAKKLADDAGIDYRLVRGSGPDGRIVAKDIEAAIKVLKPGAKRPAPAPPPRPDDELPALDIADGEAEVIEMPFRLRTQALRVVQSKHLIPHFYITRGADVTALLRRKDELKQKFGATVTHLVTFACIRALEENPAANWSYDRGRIIRWKGIHLGLAVATDQGLTVAVLRDAQALSFAELVTRSKDLVERARTGKLAAAERRHPSFTLTNLGMFDVEHFEPIINPPSAITLAVASALPTTVVRDDQIFIGRVMKLSASCDHRIVDGVAAAKFLGSLVALLENPDRMPLEKSGT